MLCNTKTKTILDAIFVVDLTTEWADFSLRYQPNYEWSKLEKGFSVIDWTRTVRWGGDGGWWWRRGQDGHDRFGLKHNSKNSQPLPRRHQSNPLYLPHTQISANQGPFPLKGGWRCKVANPWWSSKSRGDRQYERCCTRTEGEWPSSDNIRGRGNSEIKESDDDGDDDDYVDG